MLDQEYPNLEYIIIDGDSKDESVDVIRRYEKQLAYWVSEKDKGAADAIATLSVAAAPHQAQLAYLTDIGTQWVRVQSITPNYNPQWGLGENIHIAEFVFNPGSGHYYRNVMVAPSRGVPRDLMVFTTLPLNSEHPFPPCSDEPELCIQSTMPALTPDKIIEWTINPTYVPN